MRKISWLSAFVLIASMLAMPPASAESPKAGSKCSSFGQSIIASGKKFTCLMVGSKQVWNKGVKVSGKTATSAVFKAPIPITLPIAQTGEITFGNVLDHVSEIPKTAWQRVQDVIAQNSAPAPIANVVHVGPNTQLDIVGGLPRIQDVLVRNQKLWSGFTQVSRFNLLMYNAQDEPWAEEDWKKTGKEMKYFPGTILAEVKRIAGNCQQSSAPGVFSGPPDNCGGADSTALENSNDAILTFSQGRTGAANDVFYTSGAILGHEYTHAVQAAQWIGKPSSYCTEQTNTQTCNRSWNSNWGFSPCWIFEGLPNSVGPMATSENYATYLELHNNHLRHDNGPNNVTDYSQKSLHDYLFNQKSSTCYADGNLYQLGYNVGASTVEILVAIAGPQSVMALYALGAEGQDFTTAFKNVYGISWSDASTILSKVLAAEYAN